MSFPLAPFRVSSAQILDEIYVVAAAGELDVDSVPELRRELEPILAAGTRALVLDLLEVTFVDSAALALVTAVAASLRSRGGRLVLASDSIATRRIFEVTGLVREIEVAPSLKAAVESVAV